MDVAEGNGCRALEKWQGNGEKAKESRKRTDRGRGARGGRRTTFQCNCERGNNGKTSFVVLVIMGRRDARVSWLERANDAGRAEDSPRPIKPPTGLDLSTNNEQLLTFKLDGEPSR